MGLCLLMYTGESACPLMIIPIYPAQRSAPPAVAVAVVPGACERAFGTDREVDAVGGGCAGQGAVHDGKQVVRGEGVAAGRVLVVEVVGCQAFATHELAE